MNIQSFITFVRYTATTFALIFSIMALLYTLSLQEERKAVRQSVIYLLNKEGGRQNEKLRTILTLSREDSLQIADMIAMKRGLMLRPRGFPVSRVNR